MTDLPGVVRPHGGPDRPGHRSRSGREYSSGGLALTRDHWTCRTPPLWDNGISNQADLAMAELIPRPTVLQAAGAPPKTISEFVGRLATGTADVSVAIMESPSGWSEPGQRPDFDEYTVVIEGEVLVETRDGAFTVSAGQASRAPAGQWVR